GLAAVLDAASAIALDLDLELQREVFRHEVPIHDVAVAARVGRRRFPDDGAVLDAPELRVAVPPLQALAVEQRHVALMVAKIHRARLREDHDAPLAGRRRLCCVGPDLRRGAEAEAHGPHDQSLSKRPVHGVLPARNTRSIRPAATEPEHEPWLETAAVSDYLWAGRRRAMTIMRRAASGVVLFLAIASVVQSAARQEAPVPDKLIVLTFDDSAKSHATYVAPRLKKLGF